jgi:protein O-GlcNAc transferase
MESFPRARSGGRALEGSNGRNASSPEVEALRLIEEGNAIEDEGQLEEAKLRYEAAIRVAPNLARPYLNRGNVLLATGNIQEALDAFAMAMSKDPTYAAAHYNMGNAYVRSGRHSDARAAFESAIALKPDFADAEVALGGLLADLGQVDAAAECYRRALEVNPSYAEVHGNLGNALTSLGRLEAAVASYRRAVEIKPDFAAAHYNLGKTLQDLKRPDEAVVSYRRVLELNPDGVLALDLGNALLSLGQLDGAAASYRRTLEVNPSSAVAHCNLGNVLKELGQLHEAVESYHRALRIDPEFAETHYNLGNALIDLGQINDAVMSYRQALKIRPDIAAAHCNLGNALLGLGQLEDAVASYRRALELKPDFVTAHSNLGNAMKGLGRIDDALASYRRALEIDPDNADAHYNRATVLRNCHQFAAAKVSYHRALELNPDFADAHNNLGATLQDLGELKEAAASYRRALEIKPDFAQAFSNVLFCVSHMEAVDAQALFAEHCRFGEQFESPLRATWPAHRNARDPGRCLQIGFVSADLRQHPVASFIEPLLGHLAKSAALSLHAYYTHAVEDGVSARLRGYMKHWHRVARLSDAALAQKVSEDGIDILIDLSGHTAENRLLTFARRPAPVQVSWMGYPGTTGLEAMDYYLADRYFLPPSEFDSQFTEKLVSLPASAPFLPNDKAPPVNALPALGKSYVTFGSFNRMEKLSPSAIALWARLLRALPNARMVLGGMPRAGEYDLLIDWFARGGIGRDRLSFYSRCETAAYLALHHQVDICVDTFPYTGGTTTCHALWMGVPTLSLAGHTPAGRQGAGILAHVGLDGFVAKDAADFEQKGVSWAGNLGALAEVRASLRARFEGSSIRRPEVIAAGLERALRTMWQRWCAGLPAEAFEVATQGIDRPSPQTQY